MNAPETGGSSLREERRSFKMAGIFSVLALLLCLAGNILGRVNAAKVASMIAAGSFSPQEINRQKFQVMAVLDWLALGIALCAIAFGIYLARWLSAIRRRRREGNGMPPAGLP